MGDDGEKGLPEMAAKKTTAVKAVTSATAKKAPVKKATPATKAAATQKSATPKSATPKSAGKKAAAGKKQTTARRDAPALAVREDEKPWTAAEVAEVREMLVHDQQRLEEEIAAVEEEIGHLLREGGEGAGHDQADVGSNTFERDHEMSMARNAKSNLVLVMEAIERLDDGTYGICESCGNPIGKMRLQAFPRATLCMECKQRQERR
jgi:RNA polymerase-binding transcription factor